MAKPKPDGGAAFPHPSQDFKEYVSQEPEPGMTLRDYFAGQALSGLIAHDGSNPITEKQVAERCYQMAERRERDASA